MAERYVTVPNAALHRRGQIAPRFFWPEAGWHPRDEQAPQANAGRQRSLKTVADRICRDPISSRSSKSFRVPDETVQAPIPAPLVARANGLVRNALVSDNNLRRGGKPLEAHGHPLRRAHLRLELP